MTTDEIPMIGFATDGTPIFAGTAVPVSQLLDHLSEGGDLPGFLARFPDVSEKQAHTAVLMAREAIDRLLRDPKRVLGTE